MLNAIGWAVVALIAAAPRPVSAASGIELPYPSQYGTFPSTTYDKKGQRLGDAVFAISRMPNGNVHMVLESGIEGGAGNVVEAVLTPITEAGGGAGRSLRIVKQQSQSWDPEGKQLVRVEVDHLERTASCIPADTPSGGQAEVLQLPENDRVVNVPLNLLFTALAGQQVQRVDFKAFLCRGGPRFVSFTAHAELSQPEGAPRPIVHVKIGPKLGPVLSWVGKLVAPDLAFWFDAGAPGIWLGHRMPLYSQGPEVVIVRDGISPEILPSFR